MPSSWHYGSCKQREDFGRGQQDSTAQTTAGPRFNFGRVHAVRLACRPQRVAHPVAHRAGVQVSAQRLEAEALCLGGLWRAFGDFQAPRHKGGCRAHDAECDPPIKGDFYREGISRFAP